MKYLPHIALFILGAFLSIMIYRAFEPKHKPDYKPILERLDQIEAGHADTLRAILKERAAIGKDCTIIINRHENIRSNLTNPIGDSLARAIIKGAIKQGFN